MLEAIKSFLTKININYKLILFLVLTVVIILLSSKIYDYKTTDFQDRVYSKVVNDMRLETKLLLQSQKDNATSTALAAAKNKLLVDIIFGKPYVTMHLNQFSKQIAQNTLYKNMWFSIIDENGDIIKQSWDNQISNVSYYRFYVKQVSKTKEPYSFYDVNEYGLTLQSLAPVLFDGDFIGMFDAISNFDSISKQLEADGYRVVIILDDKNSKKVNIDKSFSKYFINDTYVVNSNANEIAMKLIEYHGAKYYINLDKNYVVHQKTDSLETVYKLYDLNKKPIAYIVLMKQISEIDMGNLEINQKIHMFLTGFIIIVLGLLIYYRTSFKYLKKMEAENEQLLILNTTIKEKMDELDFNEKKISNMFYVQPNFMVLSDGQKIENVNERMIWLLTNNSGGGLAEIQEKYQDISEVFEKPEDEDIDLTDYIWEDTIEGEPWKDYILSNFKRNYKTCIRDPYGNQHHFTIKMNEMKYAKFIKRYIIITLIDITNDLKFIKQTQEEQRAIMEQAKMFEMEELVNYISEQWKPKVHAISRVANDVKFKNNIELLKEDDIDKCTDNIINKTDILFDTIDTFIQFIKEKSKSHQVDIKDVAELSIKMIDSKFKEHGICIVKHFVEKPMLKTMIPGELSQVLVNIFEYSQYIFTKVDKDEKWFEITTKYNQGKNIAIITLEDCTGGVSEDVLNLIFKHTTNKTQDTLMMQGLYMSKLLVEKNLNGKISVENSKNGLKFTIVLPLDKDIKKLDNQNEVK